MKSLKLTISKYYAILIALICTFSGCQTYGKINVSASEYKDEKYIQKAKEKLVNGNIRTGYVYYYNSPNLLPRLKNIGINTVILKCWKFENKQEIENSLKRVRSWAREAKKHSINLIVAINWHPYPFVDQLKIDKVKFNDGSFGEGSDPLDSNLWKNHITPVVIGFAKMSTNPETPIAGLMFDTEIYSDKKVPENRRNYPISKSGFQEKHLKRFLKKEKITNSIDAITLKGTSLNMKYCDFLINGLETKFDELRERVFEINKHFLFSIYYHPDEKDWVRSTLARTLSTAQNPIIIFGIHSYGYYLNDEGDSWQCIPKNIEKTYKSQGIECRYVAGFLLRKFSSERLKINLAMSKKRASGFWIFRIHDLWTQKDAKNLYGESYQQAIKAYSN